MLNVRHFSIFPVCQPRRHGSAAARQLPSVALTVSAHMTDGFIIREFGVGRDALHRHWHLHVSARRKAELLAGPVEIEKLANRAAEEDRSLIDYLSILRSALFKLFMDAKASGRTFEANAISGRLLSVLEAIGKVNGQLRSVGITINNQQINSASVLSDAEVARVQAIIIRTLRPFPEARAAVIAALENVSLSDDLPPQPPFPERPPVQIEGAVAHG